MTRTVKSIIDKYKNTGSNMAEVVNSSCSGGDGQTLTTKRIKLREAPLLRNKCQVRNLKIVDVLELLNGMCF